MQVKEREEVLDGMSYDFDWIGRIRIEATGETINHIEVWLDQEADDQAEYGAILGDLYLSKGDLFISPKRISARECLRLPSAAGS